MGLLPGAGSIAQRMGAARAELASIEQQIAAAQGSLTAMRGQLAATPQTIAGVGGDSGGTASGQLAALEGQLNQNLARGWTDSHPDVVAAQPADRAAAPALPRAERAAAAGGMPNPSYVSLRAMMAEREAPVAAATARRNQLQSDLAQLGIAPVHRAGRRRRAGRGSTATMTC